MPYVKSNKEIQNKRAGFKMKGMSFGNEGPVKPKSIVSAKKEPYVKPVDPGSDEPKKIAYSRRTLNPSIKEPKTLDR